MREIAAPPWGLEGELCMLVIGGFEYSAGLLNTLHGPLSMELSLEASLSVLEHAA